MSNPASTPHQAQMDALNMFRRARRQGWFYVGAMIAVWLVAFLIAWHFDQVRAPWRMGVNLVLIMGAVYMHGRYRRARARLMALGGSVDMQAKL